VAPKKPPKDAPKPKPDAPWRVAGIEGIVPPGRRLSPESENRPLAWSASGVRGVVPPGKLAPGTGPATEWTLKKAGVDARGRPTKPSRPGARAGDAAAQGSGGSRAAGRARRGAPAAPPPPIEAGRPTAGYLPDPNAGSADPRSLKLLLDEIAAFFDSRPILAERRDELDLMIRQSHAPYEVAVGFALLASVCQEPEPKGRHARALQRGAQTYYNLAMRLDPELSPPRGLNPRAVDALFFDMPDSYRELPYSATAHAFLGLLELLRGDRVHDRDLLRFARKLERRFITGRSYGDQAVSTLLPWTEPAWAPEDDEPDAEPGA
jgi:hypothetical protein